MEILVNCYCGSAYKFEIEPVAGRMPVSVNCPACQSDGTDAANKYIAAQALAASPPPLPATEGLFGRSSFFVREHVSLLKLTDTYDILDPATKQSIGLAKEEPPEWAKLLRLLINKRILPTVVNIYENDNGAPVLSIKREFAFIPKIRVTTGDGRSLGYFKSKLFSLGGGFNVFNNAEQQVAEVKGNLIGWDFKFLAQSGHELGTVTKKWAGLGKELFTSADNYMISLSNVDHSQPDTAALLLAAGLAIDTVYKEK